jgi:hypothetical protein
MKHILLILFAFIGLNMFAQTCKNYYIPDSLIHKGKAMIPNILGGTCSSPDGVVMQILAAPGSYNDLFDGGYCYAIGPTKNFTMCFTFTAPGPDIDINSGYESSGCNSTNFNSIDLYTCDPACTFVGSGTSFVGLTTGQCYTWCLTGHCGGPGPGFDEVCPYFIDQTPLPITLLYFKGYYKDKLIYLAWASATETNNNYYSLDRSIDGLIWTHLLNITGEGTTTETQYYRAIDSNPVIGTDYYRLTQVDFNGTSVSYTPIAVNVPYFQKKIIKITNELGQEITSTTKGFFVIFYDNGTISKGYKY